MGWTDNWRGLKNAMLLGAFKPGLDTLVTTSGTIVPERAPNSPIRPISPMTSYSSSGDYAYYNFIRVGTGSTPTSSSDYKLDAQANGINYLSLANEEIVYDVANGSATKTVVVTIQNSTANSITLREWGVINRVGYDSSYNAFTGDILLYRDLFASPVTLGAYESATLTLTLTLTLNDPL